MTSAEVVIGSNFGDEGKGLITDFLSAQYGGDAIVVRFNGGAQAGHTVVAPEGYRHAFSHHCSGSFGGAGTFLSRFFVCNPLLFRKERVKLESISCTPAVYIDKRSIVTTPYDMMINQISEETRGHSRHGSCGMGFGETLERHQQQNHRIFYTDLADMNSLKKKVRAIQMDWIPMRLKALGIENISETWRQRMEAPGILQKFLDDTVFLRGIAKEVDESFLRSTGKNIIFEGAQGLLLDQNHSWFPHVTRSNTGLRNVTILAQEADIDHLKTIYVTRAYLTRHGAGPLPNELEELPYLKIKDETNILNEFQGALRFAWLDMDLMASTLDRDLTSNHTRIRIEHGVAVTCLDQVDRHHRFRAGGISHKTSESVFLERLQKATHAGFMLTSHGTSRQYVASV